MSNDSPFIIGLDFGSHISSLAIWSSEKDSIDVVADDTGSRAIPCTIAFRNEEVLVGQAAVNQQYKNSQNTFDDVLSLFLNSSENDTIFVNALDKDISPADLMTHFFRNIHNQVKSQIGSVVRDCILSVSHIENESLKSRLIAAAQAGGIRIKSIIDESAAILLAYGMDDVNILDSNAIVIDIGWKKTSISIYSIKGGVFHLLGEDISYDINGNILVNLVAEHCAKDFQRKAKFSCMDNQRAMIRLKRECESAIKILAMGAEANISVDSLCEGIDYTGKISRARFEDLCAFPFNQLKLGLTNSLSSLKLSPGAINYVCFGGGCTSHPKVVSIVKSVFPDAILSKLSRLETSEAVCVGATIHGRILSQSGFLSNLPKSTPEIPCIIDKSIAIGDSEKGPFATILPFNASLPFESCSWISTIYSDAYFKIFSLDSSGDEQKTCLLYQISIPTPDASVNNPTRLKLVSRVEVTGEMNISIFIDGSNEPIKSFTISS